MKHKILMIIVALVGMNVLPPLKAQDAAMYVYRNDGRLNAFLMNQVESMSYSSVGVDGIEYGVPVVQEIQTKDSLYRIPIAAIDSIGYQTPEPIFKKGIFFIDESNVASVADVDIEKLSITFRSGTPASQLPTKGQVIFCDLEEEPFPMGFSGRVTDVTTVGGKSTYTCEVAGPEEVYDRLLVVGRVSADGDNYSSAKRRSPRKKQATGSYNINATLFDRIKISGKGNITVDYTFDFNAFNDDPTTIYLLWQHDTTWDFGIQLMKDKETSGLIPSKWDKDVKVKEYWSPPVTLFSVYGINLVGMTGGYFSYGGSFSIEMSGLKYKSTKKVEYFYHSDEEPRWSHNELVNEGGWNFEDKDKLLDDLKVKVDVGGSISFGICAELDVAVWKPKWASLAIGGKVGPELKGSFSIDTDVLKTAQEKGLETALYKELSENVKLTFGIKAEAEILGRFAYKEWKLANFSTTLFPRTMTLLPKLSQPALPKIYRTELGRYMIEPNGAWDTNLGWDSTDPMLLKTTAQNMTLFPGPVGISIYDRDDKELTSLSAEKLADWHWLTKNSFETQLPSYTSQTVKVYPTFKFLGFIPMRGEPSEITIPVPFVLSSNNISVAEGDTTEIVCKGGWGYYEISSGAGDDYTIDRIENKFISVVQTKDSNGDPILQVAGIRAGKTSFTVKDVRSGFTRTCQVQVNPTPIAVSTQTLEMPVGDVRTVMVFPKRDYQLKNSNSAVATAFVDVNCDISTLRTSTALQIKALKVGTTKITATDPERGHVATITVTVREPGPGAISIEPSTVDFGTVCAGSSQEKTFTVSNTGESDLTFKVGKAIAPFVIDEAEKSFKLTPGNSKTFTATCTGVETGEEKTLFVPIESDAPDGGGHGITLKAQGHQYEKGICSNFYPEDGAQLTSTNPVIGCNVKFPWGGEMIVWIKVSDKPDMSHVVKGVKTTLVGSYGSTQSCSLSGYGDLQPNKKYYWNASYFDWETGGFVNCSPIMSFTTGN